MLNGELADCTNKPSKPRAPKPVAPTQAVCLAIADDKTGKKNVGLCVSINMSHFRILKPPYVGRQEGKPEGEAHKASGALSFTCKPFCFALW